MTSKNSTNDVTTGATWVEVPPETYSITKVGYPNQTFITPSFYSEYKELRENIQHLNNRLTALESLFELKLKQHEETVTLLVEAIKNAIK